MAVDLTSNLVGHWPMNATSGTVAVDLAGGDDPGTLSGGTTWTSSGKVHGGLVLNGSTGVVSVAHTSAFGVVTSNVTLAAWIKTTAAGGTVMSKGPLTGDHIALQVVGGKARFQFNPGGGPFGVTGTRTVNDGQWHHIVGIRTGLQSCALYVDGVLDGTFIGTGAFNSVDLTTPLQIGTAGTGTFFNGTVDDIRFYARALTAEDAGGLFVLGSHPVSVNDRYVIFSQSTNISASNGVLSNDGRRDETPVTASVVTAPTHGALTLNSDGSFLYVPQSGFSGLDSFTYRASDDVVDPAAATVFIQVVSLAEWTTIGSRVFSSAMENATTISASSVNTIVALMNADGSFSDLTYTANSTTGANAIKTSGTRLSTMSRAYQAVGGPKYLDAALKQKIIDGYTYLANTAPNSLAFPNWYDTKIGVGLALWQGLIAMRNDLSSTLINNLITKYYDIATVWDLKDLTGKNGGANLTDRAMIAVVAAVLRNDLSDMSDVISLVTDDLNSQGFAGSGLQPDSSLSQHTSYASGASYRGGVHPNEQVQLYSSSYGQVYATDLSRMLPWFHGTSFAFDAATEAAAVGYLLDGQAWLIRNKTSEPTTSGRAISNKGATLNGLANNISAAATRIQPLGIRTTELQSLVSRIATGSTSTNFLSGNKSFYTTDTMIQQRQGFMASVRMISQRTIRPETLTLPGGSISEGAKNFFLADGVTTLYESGSEYGTTSGQEIFPAWNWTRLPGTTLEQLTDAELISLSNANTGASGGPGNIGTGLFVGSVSNGIYGAAAMDYGRSQGSVTAKKSYFYFDEGYVALGTAINAPTATKPVYTSLNQVLQNGSVTAKASDGTLQTFGIGTTQNLVNPKWVLHNGVGYAFLGNNGNVTAQLQSQTGTWESIGTATGTVTQNVFSTWVDHGSNPQNGSYAYAVLPGKNTASLDSYLASSPLSVLSNTSSIQAVRNNVSSVTQIAFYQAGSITIASGLTIAVDKPGMVQIRELSGKNIELTASDPTQSSTQLKVTISRRLSGANTLWNSSTGNSEVTLTLPSGTNNINAGQSITSNLTFVATPATIVSRNVYYRSSFFDTTANSQSAIDPTKSALLPGGTASIANYTNYSRGINGIIVDLTNAASLAAIDS
ncbi:MAG: polysaccharide lyase beta-sandwich domain-containing protein, partial [Planctomycetota bacterium]|nr:polysaccharide lyase beta-sandwich domain-containing protein [Planctomycetota bacterium]